MFQQGRDTVCPGIHHQNFIILNDGQPPGVKRSNRTQGAIADYTCTVVGFGTFGFQPEYALVAGRNPEASTSGVTGNPVQGVRGQSVNFIITVCTGRENSVKPGVR